MNKHLGSYREDSLATLGERWMGRDWLRAHYTDVLNTRQRHNL